MKLDSRLVAGRNREPCPKGVSHRHLCLNRLPLGAPIEDQNINWRPTGIDGGMQNGGSVRARTTNFSMRLAQLIVVAVEMQMMIGRPVGGVSLAPLIFAALIQSLHFNRITCSL